MDKEREFMKTDFRRHLAHPPPIRRHNQPIVLYVTICTINRQKILATSAVQKILVEAWRGATHWLAGHYVIMPDHVHFFCVPGIVEYPPIRRWAGYWKRLVGKLDAALLRVFQENCWDTQMRSLEHYDEKVGYMKNNPVREGLVDASDEWPFQGKVFDVPRW